MTALELRAALLRDIGESFRPAGTFACHFARGKLGGDPVFMAMLEQGWLMGSRRILDLGCGQGLLSAWLIAARSRYERGDWPAGWPEPPPLEWLHGIDLRRKDVERARRAVGAPASFAIGDLRDTPLESCDAIVIIDVLHYIDREAQARALDHIRAALPAGGRLLLRVGNAGGGLPFLFSKVVDALVLALRGRRSLRLFCRSIGDWRALLTHHRFASQVMPLSQGTPFANVMLVSSAT